MSNSPPLMQSILTSSERRVAAFLSGKKLEDTNNNNSKKTNTSAWFDANTNTVVIPDRHRTTTTTTVVNDESSQVWSTLTISAGTFRYTADCDELDTKEAYSSSFHSDNCRIEPISGDGGNGDGGNGDGDSGNGDGDGEGGNGGDGRGDDALLNSISQVISTDLVAISATSLKNSEPQINSSCLTGSSSSATIIPSDKIDSTQPIILHSEERNSTTMLLSEGSQVQQKSINDENVSS